MEKIAISKIVEFRRLKDGPRITLINNLKKPKPPKKPKSDESSDGGDYWSTSIWAISNAYKDNSPILIKDKITDLLGRHGKATAKISKDMYLQNIPDRADLSPQSLAQVFTCALKVKTSLIKCF